MNHPQLQGFPAIIQDRVSWSDMDAFAHVSNLVYFRYFQEARIDYLSRLGWFKLRDEKGLGPIVGSTQARFRKPLTYPDRIWVGAKVLKLELDRVTFEHRLVSEQWGDELVAEGQAVIVSFDYRNGTKTPIPQELVAKIKAMQPELLT